MNRTSSSVRQGSVSLCSGYVTGMTIVVMEGMRLTVVSLIKSDTKGVIPDSVNRRDLNNNDKILLYFSHSTTWFPVPCR